jgi:hypothetical protein
MSLRALMDLSRHPGHGFEGLPGASVAGVPAGVRAPEAGVCGAGATFLCFGVSGSTKGPFWPHPITMPPRHAKTQKRAIFMPRVYRVGGARVPPELLVPPVCPTLQHPGDVDEV